MQQPGKIISQMVKHEETLPGEVPKPGLQTFANDILDGSADIGTAAIARQVIRLGLAAGAEKSVIVQMGQR